jgi:hypothetical protein
VRRIYEAVFGESGVGSRGERALADNCRCVGEAKWRRMIDDRREDVTRGGDVGCDRPKVTDG